MMTLLTVLWLLSLTAAFLCGWIFCASFSATTICDLSDQIAQMKRDRDWQAANRDAREQAFGAEQPLPFVPFSTRSIR